MRRRAVIGSLFGLGTGATNWLSNPLEQVDASDHVPVNSKQVSPGTTVEGTLIDGTKEWFSIDLKKRDTLSVALLGCDDWTDRRAEVALYALDGTVLDSTEVASTELPRVVIGSTTPETGTYAVRIASLEGEIPYSMLFDVADEGPNEMNDDCDSAAEIGIGDPVDGVIIDDEEDWFVFETAAGNGIELELTAHDLVENRDIEMALFDSTGSEIGEVPRDRPFGAYSTVSNFVDCTNLDTAIGADVAEEDGSYFIRVQGVNGAVHGFSAYDLTVETVDLGQNEPNENRETATPLTPGEPVEATLAGYDHDWYQFEAKAGDEIVIDYEITQSVDLFSSEVTLYDPQNNVLRRGLPDQPVTTEMSGTYSIHIAQSDEMGVKPFLKKEGYRLTILSNEDTPC